MFRSFRLGTAFGIPLYLHSSFFLLSLYALFLSRNESLASILFGQAVLLSIFGCVMLHELGHALMARFFGIGTRDITLYPIGGVARLDSTGNHPHEELCIALAGPAVNLLIVILLSPLVLLSALAGLIFRQHDALVFEGGATSMLAAYVAALWGGNGVLLLFNLLPAFPMDGGRVLRALLGMTMSHLRATEIAATFGLFMAVCLAWLGWTLSIPGLILVAIFVAVVGQQELLMLRRREAHRRAEAFSAQDAVSSTVVVEPLWARSTPAGSAGEGGQPVSHPDTDGSHGGGFTGYLWDRDNRVWIRWINGRPVQAC